MSDVSKFTGIASDHVLCTGKYGTQLRFLHQYNIHLWNSDTVPTEEETVTIPPDTNSILLEVAIQLVMGDVIGAASSIRSMGGRKDDISKREAKENIVEVLVLVSLITGAKEFNRYSWDSLARFVDLYNRPGMLTALCSSSYDIYHSIDLTDENGSSPEGSATVVTKSMSFDQLIHNMRC
jgi:hypothetical protein